MHAPACQIMPMVIIRLIIIFMLRRCDLLIDA